jgi:hypothetical protein
MAAPSARTRTFWSVSMTRFVETRIFMEWSAFALGVRIQRRVS